MNPLVLTAFLLLVPYFWFLLREQRWWRLLLGSVVFRLIYGLLLVYYIFDPVLFGHSILIFLGLPALVYFYKKAFPKISPGATATFIGVAYLVFDYLEARYTLIPSFITHSSIFFSSTGLVGLGRWLGWWGLGAFAVALTMLAALAFVSKQPRRYVTAILFSLLFGALISQFFLKQNAADYAARPHYLEVALISVRPTFDSDPAQFQERLDTLAGELEPQRYDLVVFPEGLFDLEVADPASSNVLKVYRNLARYLHSSVLVNVNLQEGSARYNSSILIDPSGELVEIYRKRDLIFVGEYSPGWLGPSEYDPGEAEAVFSVNGGQFASPICFESHLPHRLNSWSRDSLDFLVNSSSNRWVPYGLADYLDLTFGLRRVYAAAYGLPILINGRNDYAGVILPDGSFDRVALQPGQEYTIYKGRVRIN